MALLGGLLDAETIRGIVIIFLIMFIFSGGAARIIAKFMRRYAKNM